jgi:hypothetical protein
MGDIMDRVEETAAFWEDLWNRAKGPDSRPGRPDWFDGMRQAAADQAQDLEPITDKQVAATIRASPTTAGMGLDGWLAGHWKHLEPEALHTLGDLLRGSELALAWPDSTLLTLMMKLAKPGRGHILIALTGGLYRCWAGIGRPHMASWEAQLQL